MDPGQQHACASIAAAGGWLWPVCTGSQEPGQEAPQTHMPHAPNPLEAPAYTVSPSLLKPLPSLQMLHTPYPTDSFSAPTCMQKLRSSGRLSAKAPGWRAATSVTHAHSRRTCRLCRTASLQPLMSAMQLARKVASTQPGSSPPPATCRGDPGRHRRHATAACIEAAVRAAQQHRVAGSFFAD